MIISSLPSLHADCTLQISIIHPILNNYKSCWKILDILYTEDIPEIIDRFHHSVLFLVLLEPPSDGGPLHTKAL